MILSSNSPHGMSIRDGLDRETVETLKWFARLLGGDKRIIRKGELISLIAEHLQGDHLRELWRRLDHIQQAALAETIHSQNLRFDEAHFKANSSGSGGPSTPASMSSGASKRSKDNKEELGPRLAQSSPDEK